MKKISFILFLLLNASMCWAQFLIQSPNENVRVTLHSNRARKGASKFLVPTKMTMKVFNQRQMLTDKEIGLTVKSDGHRYAFGKLNITKANNAERQVDHPDTKDPMLANLEGRYNSMMLGTDEGIVLEVRAYNNGVAYRFRVSGYTDDYKILEVCNVFPEEKAIAILGTFTGEYVMPWRTMEIEGDNPAEKATTKTLSQATDRGTKHVSWKDALSSVSVGISFNWYNGDTWGDIGEDHTITADFTYKHLYAGLSYTPCHELQYIHYDKDFWPFEGVIGSIHSWGLGARFGYNIPLQNGHEVWNISPYVATTLMHLKQHGKTRIGYNTVDKHNHYLVGPGVKVQFATRERITLGVAYEYQFFTDRKAPTGMSSLQFSIGKLF